MSSRFLVTGGAGFIGSHLVRALLARGDAVSVLDDLSTGKESNLEGLAGPLTFHRGSVADAAAVERAIDGCRGVFHIAALPSVTRSLSHPVESHHANVTGTVTVLHAAAKCGARVVYAGSSSAYGDQDAPAKHEMLREDPLSPYAATKLAGELYCRSFAKVYGLDAVVTRFFNVFGPRQTADSPYSGVIAAFCHALLHGRSPRIDGDGRQSRDFTYVEDVVLGVLCAMDARTKGCEVVNIAYGSSITLLELLDVLQGLAGTSLEPTWAQPRSGDVRHSLADVTRASNLLGYRPKVGFAEGIRRTFDWYRSQIKS
ncbi:MAG: hypothetical protein RIT25_2029 [Planctomycetota bacterium]